MVRRIRHNATVAELEKSVADIEESISILDGLISKTPWDTGVTIDNTAFSLRTEFELQKADLICRKKNILEQIQRRMQDE